MVGRGLKNGVHFTPQDGGSARTYGELTPPDVRPTGRRAIVGRAIGQLTLVHPDRSPKFPTRRSGARRVKGLRKSGPLLARVGGGEL